jgi:TRAP-type C4-dicarboxylate transport system permease small subunit
MSFFAPAFARLIDACGATAGAIFAAVALLVTADVVLRNLGLGNLPWLLEFAEYAMPLATFLTAPWLLRRGEHVRIDMLAASLPRPAARALDAATAGIGAAIAVALAIYGARAAVDSWQTGALVIKQLIIPEWWLLVPMPLSMALLAVVFVQRIAAIVGGDAR